MGTDSKNDNLVNLCTRILYKEYDEEIEEQFFTALEENRVDDFNDYTLLWCLNTLNFITTNNICDRIKFVKLESLKLKLLSYFASYNEYLSEILDTDPAGIDEVLKEVEGVGKVYKRYLPSRNVRFQLPKKGTTSNLRVVSMNDKNKEYTATVVIDHEGYVTEVLKDPCLTESLDTPETYEDLYTNLLTDILKYKDEGQETIDINSNE